MTFFAVVLSSGFLACLQIHSLLNVAPRICDFILTLACNSCSLFFGVNSSLINLA